MTLTQLALLRHIVEKAKEGGSLTITNNEKVDLDYINTFLDNLITSFEKEMKERKGKHETLYYRLGIEINQ